MQHYPDVLMSIVGFALFLAVGITSARAARRRMTRETWYSVHLYAYLAVALAFAHQLAVGTDFSSDRLARVWWISLYVAVLAAIVLWRVGRPLWFNARHRLRIHSVRPEANGVVSLYLTGERLDEIGAVAGQFFLWRFLTGSGWAKAHPFSLSAAPNGRFLRITVKALGDDTLRMQSLKPGVRVFAEGPYGTFTAQRRTRPRVALIAGGIGITPLRALLQTLPRTPGEVTLLYRAASHDDMAFRDELHAIADRVGVDVRILPGSDIGDDQTDQLGIPALRQHIPDIADRDVFVCGPPAMLNAVRRASPRSMSRTDRSTTNGSSTDGRLTSRCRHSLGHGGSAHAPGQLPHQLRVEQPHCRERGRRRGNDGDDGRRGHRFRRLPDHCGSASATDNAAEHRAPERRAAEHRGLDGTARAALGRPHLGAAPRRHLRQGEDRRRARGRHALRRCPGARRAAGQPHRGCPAAHAPERPLAVEAHQRAGRAVAPNRGAPSPEREHRPPLRRQLHERGVRRIAPGRSRCGAVVT